MKKLYDAVRTARAPQPERCDLCAVELFEDHDHLYAPATRELRCACKGCAMIIPTAERSPYRRVPKRFDAAKINARTWLERLGVPVGVAAVIAQDGGTAVVAYPGPAGLVHAELEAAVWNALRSAVPAMTPEVEALVLSSLSPAGAWIAGVDVVFELVGELRRNWHGLTGGGEGPAAIARVLAAHAGGNT